MNRHEEDTIYLYFEKWFNAQFYRKPDLSIDLDKILYKGYKNGWEESRKYEGFISKTYEYE